MTFHKIYLMLQEFSSSYDRISSEHITELIETVLETLQKATGEAYKMCIEALIDLITDHSILLNFTDEKDISLKVKETFKKLLFEQNYDYTLKLQQCVLSSLKVYYQSLVEVFKRKGDAGSNTNKNSEFDKESDEEYDEESEGDISSIFFGLLIRIAQFENYNQIDFNTNPEKIIKIMKGFVMLGGYSYINIGFGAIEDDDDEFDQEKTEHRTKQKIAITRIVNLLDEFKESRKKISGQFTILDFICSFKRYNDFAFEMIDNESPLTWLISSPNLYDMNLFEFALDKNNINLAMRLVEKCDITKVISNFPLKAKNLTNLVESDYIVQFLE